MTLKSFQVGTSIMDEIPLFQAPHHVQFLSKVDIFLELEGFLTIWVILDLRGVRRIPVDQHFGGDQNHDERGFSVTSRFFAKGTGAKFPLT